MYVEESGTEFPLCVVRIKPQCCFCSTRCLLFSKCQNKQDGILERKLKFMFQLKQ